jgi:bacterioferritin (cytochrome b1)
VLAEEGFPKLPRRAQLKIGCTVSEELAVMKNINMVVDKDNILTIKVDLNKKFGESKSGKSEVIASTEGNVALDGELSNIKIGLNVYKQLYSGRDWQHVD